MKSSRVFYDLCRLMENQSQYRKRAEICEHPPLRFWIEPTSHCNLGCPMCPTGIKASGSSQGLMNLELYRSIIDQIAPYAVDINLFFKGEPLLHRQLPEMIRYAVQKGLRTRLETNATLLNESLSRKILEAGLGFLSFSFDGYSAAAYETLRPGAEFERTMNAVMDFLRIRKEGGFRAPLTFLQVIEMPAVKAQGTEERQAFRRRFEGLGLNGFRIIKPHRFAGQISEEVTGTRFGYVDSGAGRKPRIRYMPCPYPWFGLVIAWDGSVVPCCMDFNSRYPLGNAGREDLLGIWNSPLMRDLRVRLREGRYKELAMCRDCDMLWQESTFGVSQKNLRDAWMFLRESMLF